MSARAGWAALTLALVLVVTESALRLYTTREGLLYTWERTDGVVMLDPATGAATLRPGSFEHTRDGPYGWAARVNAQGLRMDGTVPEKAPPGQRRWLLLGDSWAFGIATRQGSGLAARLSGALAEAGGIDAPVINGGIPGASAWDVLQRWRALAAFEVAGVVVKVPVNYGSAAARAAVRSRSGEPPDVRILLGLRRLVALARARELRIETPEAAREAEESLRTLVGEARRRRLAVVVLVAPLDRAASADTARTDAEHARWSHVFADDPEVRVVAHRLTERSCFGWVDESHPSESGAEVLAQTVADATRTASTVTNPAPAGARAEPRCDVVDAVGPGKAQVVRPIDPWELGQNGMSSKAGASSTGGSLPPPPSLPPPSLPPRPPPP